MLTSENIIVQFILRYPVQIVLVIFNSAHLYVCINLHKIIPKQRNLCAPTHTNSRGEVQALYILATGLIKCLLLHKLISGDYLRPMMTYNIQPSQDILKFFV